MDKETSPRVWRALLAVALAGGGAWRFWYALVAHRPIDFDYSDMHGYIAVARRIADPGISTNVYDWYYPRGTAAALSVFVRLFGEAGWPWAAAWQALMSTAEIGAVYWVTRRLFNPRVGALAAFGLATHYLAVSFAGFFMSENYLAFALILGFVLAAAGAPGRSFLAGIAFGLAVWVKPQAFVVVLLLGAWWILRLRQLRAPAALLLGSLLVVVPASILTSKAAGRPTFISLNGGQTFALSQCPYKSVHFKTTNYEMGFGLPTVFQRIGRGEAESHWPDTNYDVAFTDNAYYMREGWKCIARDPWMAAKLAALHLADILAGPVWSPVAPWPESATAWGTWATWSNYYLSYCIAPLALLGMWWSRRNAEALGVFLASVGAVVISALIFHGDPRFRAPYDFVLFIGAAVALERTILWLRARLPGRQDEAIEPLLAAAEAEGASREALG